MDMTVGTVSINFTANDTGVQQTINSILNTLNQVQSKASSMGSQISKGFSGVSTVANQQATGVRSAMNTITTSAKNGATKIATATTSIKGSFSKILSSMKSLIRFAVFSYIGRQIINLGKTLFTLGSDMAEVENLFQVSFGNMSTKAEEFANMLQSAYGVDTTPVKEQTAYLNAMFTSMKFGENTAYTMSTELEKLSYNMSSLYNISQTDAYEKLRSGMAGQIRPLKQLGILIDDTTIKQYALDNGIVKSTSGMTQQQKALARYYAILDQTKSSWASTTEETKNGTRTIGDLEKTLKLLGVYKSGEHINIWCEQILFVC
jgi:hypothetical protein